MKKVYSVDFIQYTNCLNTAVTDDNHENYITVDNPFLIFEDEIEYYMKFGGGIKNMIFVGYMDQIEGKK